jgi:hypothetical protein
LYLDKALLKRASGEGEGGCLWWMYFVLRYENRTKKPVEIVLRRKIVRMRENSGSN